MSLATLSLSNKCMPFCTFFPVLALQNLLKSVKILQSCSQMYTDTFYESWQKCRF